MSLSWIGLWSIHPKLCITCHRQYDNSFPIKLIYVPTYSSFFINIILRYFELKSANNVKDSDHHNASVADGCKKTNVIMNVEYLKNVSTTRMGSKGLRSLLCVIFVICAAAEVRLCFSSSLLTFPPFLLKFLR